MVAAALAGLVLGSLLGLRFRVLVLLPVEMAASAAGFLAALSGGATGGAAFAGFALFSLCLQSSYVAALASLPAARHDPAVRAEA